MELLKFLGSSSASLAVADPRIHFTGDVNKIIKYNDKIYFFSLYILYFYYNMVNIFLKK
jgi:hypothetical protein